GYGSTNYRRREPTSPVKHGLAVSFIDPERREVGTRTNYLSKRGFDSIEFTGEYPVARVKYADAKVPLSVQLEAFSPFIPGNAADSAMPATVLNVTLENASSRRLICRLVGWLENAVCFHTRSEIRALHRTRTQIERGRLVMVHTAEPDPAASQEAPRPPIVLA